MRISTIFGTKMAPFVLNKNFLVQTIVITFIYLLALFIVENLKKLLKRIQNYGDAPFLGPKLSICSKQTFFFGKLFLSFSSTFQPLHCAKLKKNSSSRSRVTRMCNFWAQNGSFPLMRFFSKNLFMSLVCFIHVYLHAKNQSQILIDQ